VAFTETVKVVIDIVTGNAKSGLASLKSDVASAEGGFAKLKAGVQGAGQMLGSLPLPVVAGAIGTAAAAVKGLGDNFTKTALDAKSLSSATGLSVEAASEWIAAGDDVGVTADMMSAAFGRATKNIGAAPEKFEALGISIRHASDGSVDMKETLLGAIDVINGIQDPTQKAAVASQVFGKAWQSMTPILERGSGALRDIMADTSDAQRITDDEVAAAKRWQAAMDDLGDTLTDVELQLGGLIVQGLSPSIAAVADMGRTVTDLSGQLSALGGGPIQLVGNGLAFWIKNLSPVGESLRVLETAATTSSAAVGLLGDALGTSAPNAEATARSIEAVHQAATIGLPPAVAAAREHEAAMQDQATASDALSGAVATMGSSLHAAGAELSDVGSTSQIAKQSQDEFAAALKVTSTRANEQSAELDRLSQRMQTQQNAALGAMGAELNLEQAVNGLSGALTTQSADSLDVREKVLGVASAASELAGKQAEARGQVFTANDSINAQQGALETLRGQFPQLSGVIDGFIGRLNSIPRDTEVEVHAHATGLDAIMDEINRIARQRPTVFVDFKGGTHVGGAAAGGVHEGPTIVGERGPELVDLPSGSFVHTASDTRSLLSSGGGGNTYVNVNMPPGSDGDDVVRALKKYERRNGSVPIRVA
jgi:hypothetical protein